MRASRPWGLCRVILVVLLVPQCSAVTPKGCPSSDHCELPFPFFPVFCVLYDVTFRGVFLPNLHFSVSRASCATQRPALCKTRQSVMHMCLLKVSVLYLGQEQLGALATGPDNMAGVASYQCMYVSCWRISP